jgi:catalase (peroxidase I)
LLTDFKDSAGNLRRVPFWVLFICVLPVADSNWFGRQRSTGFAGPWVEEMTIFSNEYAGDLVGDKWVEVTSASGHPNLQHEDLRPVQGNRQYVSLGPLEGPVPNPAPVQMMLISDMALLWVNEWRYWVEFYADEAAGEARLIADFGKAFKRLTELGFQASADVCPFQVTTAPAGWAPAPQATRSPPTRDYRISSYEPRR